MACHYWHCGDGEKSEKARGTVTPRSPLDSRRGLTIVLLAQIKLATVSRRNNGGTAKRRKERTEDQFTLSRRAWGRVNLHIEIERSWNRPDFQPSRHSLRNAVYYRLPTTKLPALAKKCFLYYYRFCAKKYVLRIIHSFLYTYNWYNINY